MHQDTHLCKGVTGVDIAAVVKTSTEIQKIYADGINPDGSLKPEAIRSLLKLKGINVKILAETNNFVDPQIHQVINREYPDFRIRRLLANTLNLPYECVWGKVAQKKAV